MAVDELFRIFPAGESESLRREQQLKTADLYPNYGYTEFHFRPSDYASKDNFKGISDLIFYVFDRKVVMMRAGYAPIPAFESMAQFMTLIVREFNLPDYKNWQGYAGESLNPSINCDGFMISVRLGNINQDDGSFSISMTEPSYSNLRKERLQADRARKREGYKP